MDNRYSFAPCLIDEVMEESLLKFDVDLGMSSEPLLLMKGSPSHESDSGCSEMFEIDVDTRSVSPSCYMDLLSSNAAAGETKVNLFDLESLSCESINGDDELERYLAIPVDIDNKKIAPSLPLGPEIDELVDDVPARSVVLARSKVPTTKPQSNRIILPSIQVNSLSNIKPSDKTAEPNIKKTKSYALKPSVKVVKVIKTPATSSKEDIDNQLMEALDERNKKNAVLAKLNREKKKAYMKGLEDEINKLKTENSALRETNEKVLNEKNILVEEVEYLRSVLANDSALSGLLKNIGNFGSVKMSSAVGQKRSVTADHDYLKQAKRPRLPSRTAGVCLHVDQGSVSLEFCSKCASMAV